MSAPKLADALANSHVVHDRAALEAAIQRIADDIRGAYADGEVPLFLTVMNGGLPFAAQLAFALGERGLDLEFDYLHATRYRGQTSGSAADVRVAVLAEKVHDRCVDGIRADHVGVQVPDAYVFGYGMDFHEQGRNLPAIYALGD
jgi:hypoxanthine phosphoribosyltransferase